MHSHPMTHQRLTHPLMHEAKAKVNKAPNTFFHPLTVMQLRACDAYMYDTDAEDNKKRSLPSRCTFR
eukprot:m.49012 g.49012  ORF g.49012 m.49012 type:complete len:67 (+) comp11073_c0_seq4:1668-1868(+)